MSDNARGALLLAFTMGLFASSDTLMKLALRHMPVGQILAMRGAIIFALLLGWLLWRRRAGNLQGCLDRFNLLRAFSEAATAVAFFMGLARLPLAVCSVVLFTAPLIMTAVAAFGLGERVSWRRWAAVLVGFVGVLFVARPQGAWSFALLFPFVAAVFVSVRDLMTRYVDPRLDAAAVGLTTACAVGLVGLATLPLGALTPLAPAWTAPPPHILGLVTLSSLAIALAYVTIVAAYRLGEASFLSPFRYSTIPFALVFGALVFGERHGAVTLFGAAVVVASGLLLFERGRGRPELRPRAP
ncbi:MAG: DMT family transporter [Geminicoccaceae bacterium]|nr:DMT family transporter [Geminicoccaceae bacterium]